MDEQRLVRLELSEMGTNNVWQYSYTWWDNKDVQNEGEIWMNAQKMNKQGHWMKEQ